MTMYCWFSPVLAGPENSTTHGTPTGGCNVTVSPGYAATVTGLSQDSPRPQQRLYSLADGGGPLQEILRSFDEHSIDADTVFARMRARLRSSELAPGSGGKQLAASESPAIDLGKSDNPQHLGRLGPYELTEFSE